MRWLVDYIRAEGCRSRFCFPCISGTCPLGMDFMRDCYPKLTSEQKALFDELFGLRAEVAREALKNPQVLDGVVQMD